jgi:hypothetical protein
MTKKYDYYRSIISNSSSMARLYPCESPLCCALVADAAVYGLSTTQEKFSPNLIKGWTKTYNEYKLKSTLTPNDEKMFHLVEEFLKIDDDESYPPNIYRFVREGDEWFIDIPEYVGFMGTKADLQMVSGADTMLDNIAGQQSEVTLRLEDTPFPGSDELILLRKSSPETGGGDYLLRSFEGKAFNQEMWLCRVTEFIFGDLPESIFIKRVQASS